MSEPDSEHRQDSRAVLLRIMRAPDPAAAMREERERNPDVPAFIHVSTRTEADMVRAVSGEEDTDAD